MVHMTATGIFSSCNKGKKEFQVYKNQSLPQKQYSTETENQPTTMEEMDC